MDHSPLQIIFLFDLNAYSDLRPRSGPELHRKLLCLRLSCLKILIHYSKNVHYLKWGFKFFDSRGKITQTMCKFFFPNVTLESYETLENEITSQYLRHAAYLELIAESSEQNSTLFLRTNTDSPNQNSTTPVQLLQLALNEMLGEFQWESSVDSFSPCIKKRWKKEKKNLLFYISRCAKDENDFKEFFGSEFSSLNYMKLSKLLLSPTLHERLLDQASIQWIWFNISEKLENSESVILKMVSEALKSMGCILLLQSTLPQSTQMLKFKEGKDSKSLETCNLKELTTSILPFSTVFQQSISYPFYTNDWKKLCAESSISYNLKEDAIPILLCNFPLSWNRKESSLSEDSCPSKIQHWSKINVFYAVDGYEQMKSSDKYLCIPDMHRNTSSCQIFQQLNVSLILNNVNLFIVCESTCGAMKPGLYTPLTDTSATISILTEKSCYFLIEKHASNCTFLNCIEDSSVIKVQKKIEKIFPNLVVNSWHCKNHLKPPLTIKQLPFQLECLESWFRPQHSIASLFDQVLTQEPSTTTVEDFHSQLLKSIKKNVKEESSELSDKTENKTESTEIIAEQEEILTDIQYEDLIAKLLKMFNSVLENNRNALQTAKRIVKYASSFFLQQSIVSYEQNLKNFMAEYFHSTYQKLNEKYNQDSDTSDEMMVTECQMQVFLYLEMEILFPSMDGSTCIEMVTAFLRRMTFLRAPEELNKFLLEVLKPNYGHVLQNILAEIENEFTIDYYNSDDDSLEEISDTQFSQSVQDNFDCASLSIKSGSSVSSNKSDKKRVPHKRSDICDTRKSRQIVLPTKSPKKKKNKGTSNADKIPIRYSPRLASRRKKELYKSVESKPGSVRRNLFPKDKKLQTPRKKNQASPLKKMSATTPKGHHVLKTEFVPGTPAYKQRHSAIYRKMSQANVTPSKEVADSPSISKKAKDTSHLKLLQQLKEKRSQSASTLPQSSASLSLPSCSYQVAKTPQSKNRLSLKLFSKLLSSPTARVGFKKCSKRLFEEDSPRADRSKRIKLFEDQEKNC